MSRARQQAPDESEHEFWEAHGDILGDILQDEKFIADAPALATGCDLSKHLYFFVAQRPLPCVKCRRDIQPGDAFSSICYRAATAATVPVCVKCRAIKKFNKRRVA